ncbi:MAG: PQQ-dependent sugar dehydrogenase [Euryarchaeota archaeon]|nr:PQQ-dependent sugar dehydrogenase [Euryarchaeota archaeon]
MTPKVAALIAIVGIAVIVGALVLDSAFYKPPMGTTGQYDVKRAFPYLHFTNPVGIYNAGNGSNQLFVVEQAGTIKVFENGENVSTTSTFLDLTDRVRSGGELGLLGLAFHPHFNENGYFYVYYTADNPLRSVVSRFSVSHANGAQADKSSETIVLQVGQPFTNHNGGQIAFGPEGYLYIALGDGGGEGDPLGNGQNRSTLLGSILRVDVDVTSNGLNYSIPRDNPFVGNTKGYREEIYAYGLRNPWRFSFDPITNRLWAGDVGQNRMEEIDIIENGKNYGWNIMEGSLCYSPPSGCNQTGLTLPIWEYDHSLGDAVTGGFVYRGSALPDLVGAYVYGDYGSGRIWALRYNDTGAPLNIALADTSLQIPSFGIDQRNELYICAFDGNIYQLHAI